MDNWLNYSGDNSVIPFFLGPIDKGVCDLDVGLELPKGAEFLQGRTVRPLNFHMI